MLGFRPRHVALLSSCAATALVTAVVACGGPGATPTSAYERGPRHVDVEIPQLELYADGIDRFATCPPQGGMTQGWIPPVATARTTPPAAARVPPSSPPAPRIASGGADGGAGGDAGAPEDEINVRRRDDDPRNAPSPSEKAIRDTLQPFRACHRRSLRSDGSQAGHVAIVARVDAAGRVDRVESYGACELSREALVCMSQVAKRLRFDPPTEGSATIIIPALFAPRTGVTRQASGQHDDYAAAAAIAIETTRPELHACDEIERRAVRPRAAWGNFVIDLDESGKAARQHIDPYGGNQELLRCASDVIGRLTFPKPPGGTATVRVRLEFNPNAAEGN